jgi:hypothetical protein
VILYQKQLIIQKCKLKIKYRNHSDIKFVLDEFFPHASTFIERRKTVDAVQLMNKVKLGLEKQFRVCKPALFVHI